MMKSDDLTLTDPKAEEQRDAVLDALSVLAYAPNDRTVIGKKGKKGKKKKAADALSAELTNFGTPTVKKERRRFKFKSRFFFKPTAVIVEERKEQFKKKQLTHIDQEIKERTIQYRAELSSVLKEPIADIRDFFLTTLGQKIYASEAGSVQAQQVLQELVGSQVDPRLFVSHDRMLEIGVNLLMAQKIAKFLGLPKTAVASILEEFYPKTTQRVSMPIPPSAPPPAQNPAPAYQARHVRNAASRKLEQAPQAKEPKGRKSSLRDWDY